MSSCWNCGYEAEAGSLFCPSCEVLQPPAPGRNHFEVLGLEPRYALEAATAERAFKALSRKLHPDRFAMAGDRERRLSLAHATALNDAYRTLKDPAKRAQYILGMWGKPITERSGSTIQLPMDFLESVMELRESLMDARMDGGDLGPALKKVRAQQRDLQGELEARFEEAGDLGHTPEPKTLGAIESLIHQQKYLQSILNEYGRAR